MHKIIRLAVLLVMITVLLCIAAPALADPPQGTVDCAVTPVTGGPNNPDTHTTPADVTIPTNNPAIVDSTDILPGSGLCAYFRRLIRELSALCSRQFLSLMAKTTEGVVITYHLFLFESQINIRGINLLLRAPKKSTCSKTRFPV